MTSVQMIMVRGFMAANLGRNKMSRLTLLHQKLSVLHQEMNPENQFQKKK